MLFLVVAAVLAMAVLLLLLLVVGSNRAPEHIMSRKMQHHQDPESPKS